MNKLTLTLKAYKSNVVIHRHSAFQIVFTEDNLFHSQIENNNHKNIFGFVIKPQVAHACECSNSTLIVMNIEAHSFFGKYLSQKLGNSNSKVFLDNLEFVVFFNFKGKNFTYSDILNTNHIENSVSNIDQRTIIALEYISNNFQSDKFSIKDLAERVFLSTSRLSFLFKKQTGSSIIKYLLWIRLRNAIFLMLTDNKKNITTIALECGFYDSSQMNKYMYQMFGISPLKFKQKSDLIQFLDVEAN
ncbi:MAG: helix-turn-helix transcriptional regulator [Bacteroidetes bacterium]|nr:helix-turn-helix transcriptional regulator [Bacteroidota bacterium]